MINRQKSFLKSYEQSRGSSPTGKGFWGFCKEAVNITLKQ